MSETTPVPLHLRRFEILPDDERSAERYQFGGRLYVGKTREHRRAAQILEAAKQRGHGEGVDTIVRALLLWQIYTDLVEGRTDAGEDVDGQLLLVAAGANPPSSNGKGRRAQ